MGQSKVLKICTLVKEDMLNTKTNSPKHSDSRKCCFGAKTSSFCVFFSFLGKRLIILKAQKKKNLCKLILHFVYLFDDDWFINNGVSAVLHSPSFAQFAKVDVDNNFIGLLENVFDFHCKYFLSCQKIYFDHWKILVPVFLFSWNI